MATRIGVPSGEAVCDPRLSTLLVQHGLSWGEFLEKGCRSTPILLKRKAVVRDLQLAGHSWAEMQTITGRSHGFIQRHRDALVPLRPAAVLTPCGGCGCPVRASRSHYARGGGRYCSHACHSMTVSAAAQRDLVCAFCGSTFNRKASLLRVESLHYYCSHACSSKGLIKSYRVLDPVAFAYLLGVVCGDGCILRQGSTPTGVTVAIGFRDEAYVEVLRGMFLRALGAEPITRRNVKARAIYLTLHGREVGELFGSVKSSEGWVLGGVTHPAEFLAGLCDTDGWWPRVRGAFTQRSFCITQKDNGNLERTLPLWDALGIPVRMAHYARGYSRAVLRVGAPAILSFKAQVPLRHPQKKVLPVTPDVGG